MLTRDLKDTNWAVKSDPEPAASDTATATAQPAAGQPLIDLVRALGAELYIDGVRVCPECKENWGSRFCTCGSTVEREVMATALDLPPIYMDLRGAR